jgi:hypothetical protein
MNMAKCPGTKQITGESNGDVGAGTMACLAAPLLAGRGLAVLL